MKGEKEVSSKEDFVKALEDVLAKAREWEDVFVGVPLWNVNIQSYWVAQDELAKIWVKRDSDWNYHLGSNQFNSNHVSNDRIALELIDGQRGYGFSPDKLIENFYGNLAQQADTYLGKIEIQKRRESTNL